MRGERYSIDPASRFPHRSGGHRTGCARARSRLVRRAECARSSTRHRPPCSSIPSSFRRARSTGSSPASSESCPTRSPRSSRWHGIEPSRPGDRIDQAGFQRALRSAVLRGDRRLNAPILHVEPERTTAAAEEALATAQELVAEPITLSFKGEDVGTLAPERLAKLVRFRPDGSRFRVTFDPDRIAKAVEPFLSEWRQRAVNARFVVDGKAVRIRPSRPGLAPDGRWISDSISAAATSSIRRASLRLKQTRADLTTAEAERARDPRADLDLHDRHGHLVVEPHPQRAADGGVHRRDDRRARRRSSRSTTASARGRSSAASARGR